MPPLCNFYDLTLARGGQLHTVPTGATFGVNIRNIGSGFYANIYLTAVDMLFGANNEWGVRFFRYVDDMIFVIPEPEDGRPIESVVDEIKEALEEVLRDLKLELNERKTEIYYDTAEFVQNAEPDALLEQVGDEVSSLTDRLWILDSACRDNVFVECASNEDVWWYRIRLYCRCLQEIGYYAPPWLVSRWIYRYLFNSHRRTKDLKINSELTIEELPADETHTAVQNWATTFKKQNPRWFGEKDELHTKLINMFLDAWSILGSPDPPPSVEQRKAETRLRFSLFKLGSLGFGKAKDEVVEMLLSSPWVTNGPSPSIESLARQGYTEELLDIFSHYRSNYYEGYLPQKLHQ